MPRMPRLARQRKGAQLPYKRQKYCRRHRDVHSRGDRLRRLDYRPDGGGYQARARTPPRGARADRPRLPFALPRHRHPLRRRGAAHQDRQIYQLSAHRHGLHSRRTKRRPPSEGYQSAQRIAVRPARPREHRAYCRAPPRGDQTRRPYNRHGPRRGKRGRPHHL